MEAPRLERKLVAILAADVEGYSRHMERDEAATLATLSAHRVIVDDLVNSHHGRITGTAGDSVLAEFASVVEAVDCAVKIQDALAAANEALPDEHRLRFRIGINVGDVMVKDGDIFGDGVNIAARLEYAGRGRAASASRAACATMCARWAASPSRIWASRASRTSNSRSAPFGCAAWMPRQRQLRPPATAPPGAADQASSDGPALRQQASPAEEAEFELTFWESIKDSQDAAEFAAYLEKYPDGTFAALAETRRSALLEEAGSADKEPEADAVELAYWDTMKDSDNPDMFRAYLERYPDGAFAPLAKVRLEELGAPST